MPDENKYDDYIAVWVDYFNKKLDLKSPLDTNMVNEVIQVYKGILNDKSGTAARIMKDYRGFYEKLKKK